MVYIVLMHVSDVIIGVLTAEDGSLYLPGLATKEDMIQCVESRPAADYSRVHKGTCRLGGRQVNLWDLHNVFVDMGGFEMVPS